MFICVDRFRRRRKPLALHQPSLLLHRLRHVIETTWKILIPAPTSHSQPSKKQLKPRCRPPSSLDRSGLEPEESNLPYDFRFSYTESSANVRPVGLREPNRARISGRIFQFIDVQNTGKITFKQFLLGSAHILKQSLFRHSCELEFIGCDVKGTNYISKQEIHGFSPYFGNDCDGRISKDDFATCIRRNPLLIALFSLPVSVQRFATRPQNGRGDGMKDKCSRLSFISITH